MTPDPVTGTDRGAANAGGDTTSGEYRSCNPSRATSYNQVTNGDEIMKNKSFGFVTSLFGHRGPIKFYAGIGPSWGEYRLSVNVLDFSNFRFRQVTLVEVRAWFVGFYLALVWYKIFVPPEDI